MQTRLGLWVLYVVDSEGSYSQRQQNKLNHSKTQPHKEKHSVHMDICPANLLFICENMHYVSISWVIVEVYTKPKSTI